MHRLTKHRSVAYTVPYIQAPLMRSRQAPCGDVDTRAKSGGMGDTYNQLTTVTVGRFEHEHQQLPSLRLWRSRFKPRRPIIQLRVDHIQPYLAQGDHGSPMMETNVIKQ